MWIDCFQVSIAGGYMLESGLLLFLVRCFLFYFDGFSLMCCHTSSLWEQPRLWSSFAWWLNCLHLQKTKTGILLPSEFVLFCVFKVISSLFLAFVRPHKLAYLSSYPVLWPFPDFRSLFGFLGPEFIGLCIYQNPSYCFNACLLQPSRSCVYHFVFCSLNYLHQLCR